MKASNFDLMEWSEDGYPLLCPVLVDGTHYEMCLKRLNEIPDYEFYSHDGQECQNPICWSYPHCSSCCATITKETLHYNFLKRPDTFMDDALFKHNWSDYYCGIKSGDKICKRGKHACPAEFMGRVEISHCYDHCPEQYPRIRLETESSS